MVWFFYVVRNWGSWLGSLLLLAALATPPAAAQVPPAAPPLAAATDTLPAAAPPLDTAATVRRLFADQRRGNRGKVVGGTLLVLTFNYLLAFSTQDTPYQRVATGLGVGYVGYGLFQLGRAVLTQQRYSAGREAQVLAALSQGRPLPPRLRRRLLADYAHPQPPPPVAPGR